MSTSSTFSFLNHIIHENERREEQTNAPGLALGLRWAFPNPAASPASYSLFPALFIPFVERGHCWSLPWGL